MAIGEWPRSYEAQVREGYCLNAIAQRAVRMVAEGVGSAPLTASDPGLAALVRARSSGQVLTETVAAHLLLHGNAYVQLLGDGLGGVGELFALRPERVAVEADANGWPVAYRYRVAERVVRIAAEDEGGRPQIVHLKGFHPLDDHYGLGCLGAAAGAIAIHNAAAKWNKALLDNAARPSGALVHESPDGSVLSSDQFERLREEMEAGFAGAANAGRPMLLEGGLKWQAMSLTPADMDFVGLKAAAAREIALAFGVPPMLLGLPGDNSYANYREANRAVWRQTILPLAGSVLASLEQALRGWDAGAALAVDVDRIAALAEDRERLWAQVSAADFLSDPEKRAMLGVVATTDTASSAGGR
ncbi:HK97 family phage portal protein [Sphingomonas japonica]|uniref:HK97 family phage portal protein n=1 Tax=Sphingomonas japonica TaxID=511662 RepID=A0ABX0U2Y4_9SPHN|nr:HK97 family phage portal protein [Sphingomonas japonica]